MMQGAACMRRQLCARMLHAAPVLASPTRSLPHSCRRAFSGAQLLLQAAVGWRCAGDLPFCFLLQTMLFVALNKVGGWTGVLLGAAMQVQ